MGPRDEARERQQRALESWASAPHPRDAAVPPREDTENAADEQEDMEVDHDENMGFIGILEPSAGDYAIEFLPQQLGSFGRSYQR